MSDMKGKTVLVTGANQGIGKASALALGKMGASLVLVCRNADRARAAVVELAREGVRDVELIVADLSAQSEVRRVAAEVKARRARLDVLLNNAGVLVPTRRTTVDGIEESFAVNHLAPFLLTHLLRDLLEHGAPARVVNVSSEAHRGAFMHWDDLEFARTPYKPFNAYGQSKLCNILFTRELARRLDGSGVTANSLHPGLVATGFGQTYGGLMGVLIKLAHPFMLTSGKGARTQVWLASSPEVEGVSGKYFDKRQQRWPSRAAQDDAAARKLWAISEQMTGLRRAPSAAA
jgi:NAD(P)-dependent dehydrogenase (short-subunit alcohol dehydrogenase family)